LVQRLDNGIDKLDSSWCGICAVRHGKTTSNEEEEEVATLLKIILRSRPLTRLG
jgi:hypothetical protein